ncbi:amidohydrolase family protein [Nocardioides endophyticus]|uniref:amidohydrolase family protein n=1 Tax=Nocardioides endophyticus TaxID=1353775 RepID=UPI0031EEEDF1
MDASAHVWSPDRQRYPWRPRGEEPPHAAYDADPVLLERDLADSGAAGAILVQPSVYADDHTYLGAVVARGNGRYAGVLLWNHHDPDARTTAADSLDRHALAGMRLSAEEDMGRSPWFDGAAGEAAWSLAAERGQPLSLLCGSGQLGSATDWAARCPDVPIVVDHLGLLDPRAGAGPLLDLVARHDHVSVRASALAALSHEPWPYRDLWPALRALLAEAGAQRLVYGTDWPFLDGATSYDAPARALDEALEWTTSERADVLGLNAVRLWGLDVEALARPWAAA